MKSSQPMRGIAAIAMTALALTACGSPAMRRSQEVDISSPAFGQLVSQPASLDWEVDEDLRARIDSGEVLFGVFVDRTPLAPGASLGDLADDDCRRQTSCPDAEWLADRNVYATRGSALQLEGLRDNRTSGSAGAEDRHRVTIVLLDETGTRIGESYWVTQFLIDRAS